VTPSGGGRSGAAWSRARCRRFSGGPASAKFGFRGTVPTESDVTVEVSGTATIAIEVAGADGYFGMPESLEVLIGWMRDSAIPTFMPFTRPG
jgi:hypothetical protein